MSILYLTIMPKVYSISKLPAENLIIVWILVLQVGKSIGMEPSLPFPFVTPTLSRPFLCVLSLSLRSLPQIQLEVLAAM